jgi:hypothetical protein
VPQSLLEIISERKRSIVGFLSASPDNNSSEAALDFITKPTALINKSHKLYVIKKMQEVAGMKQLRYLLLIAFIFTAGTTSADDPGLPGGDPDVPLDGGIIVLLIAGAVYGVKKFRGEKVQVAN